jgi:hypothetical protein
MDFIRTLNTERRTYFRLIGFLFVLGITLLTFFPAPSVSAGPLDEKKLLHVFWERLKQDKRFEKIRPEEISLQERIPISLKNLSLWAIKLKITMEPAQPGMKKPAQTMTVILVTDDHAEMVFEGLADLKTGRPLLEKALADLSQVELNPQIGQKVFTGKGKSRIVIIIDSFCPYCRVAYQNLPGNFASQIKELVFIYLPLASHPGSEMACAISSYIHQQKGLKEHAPEVDDFIFKDLTPPKIKDQAQAQEEVYKAVRTKFPWFAKEFSGLTWEEGLEKLKKGSTVEEQIRYAAQLGIASTPIIFVNGRRIDGLDWNKFQRYLTY